MKAALLLPVAAIATASVIPEQEPSWAELPDRFHDQLSSNILLETSDRADLHLLKDFFSGGFSDEDVIFPDFGDVNHPEYAFATEVGHDKPEPTLTAWDQIKELDNTKLFVEIAEKFDDVVEALSSTSASYTVFVPTDDVLDSIDGDEPSLEEIGKDLRHHIAIGSYDRKSLWGTYTLPTLLHNKDLGGESQRLRTRVGLRGVQVNFHTRTTGKPVYATNGVIHLINRVVYPPPDIFRELELLPTIFSTLLHAYEVTSFRENADKLTIIGGTLFTPTNSAFSKLGMKANAFLFGTEKGKHYLDALLKYQAVPNVTLYSDAVYDKTEEGDKAVLANDFHLDAKHFELKTLLHEAPLHVEISKIAHLPIIHVNKRGVIFQDGVAEDGVIHVLNHIPIPPHKNHKGHAESVHEGEITVEELIERLSPYVEEEVVQGQSGQGTIVQDL